MAVKRLLAVVVAVALITGAVVIRRFIDDGGESHSAGRPRRSIATRPWPTPAARSSMRPT
ncbi:MAG: hypothetical protein R2710_09420 [Acidimicrobiales bacterium]